MQIAEAIKIIKAHRLIVDDPIVRKALDTAVVELAQKANEEANPTKKDCFAYQEKDGEGDCAALRQLYCEKEKCSFYKPKK
jgi:uncharacterized membrane protein